MGYKQKYFELFSAASNLYEAGHWTCDRQVNEMALWEALRDAMERKPGNAPVPIKEKK